MTDKATERWIRFMNFGAGMGCHQMPERSFFYKGYQFPVCARCTGVLIGELLSIVLFFICPLGFWYSFLFLVPMGVDWGLQYLKILMSSNIRRLITGIFGGYGLTNIYIYIAIGIFKLIAKLFI